MSDYSTREFKIHIPENASRIIDVIQQAGYEAYVVGGCVRDAIMGRKPNDWDITTSALPTDVKALFKKTVDTGLKHGTVTVLMGGESFEVTTYRIDGEYGDGRHPDQVTFTASLEEDLKRRDFTINAMAYNYTAGLVDLFDGREDLRRKCIRAVGDPEKRFSEDALRILRAVRFAAQFGFGIEPETSKAIRELAPTLQKVSAERIRDELNKLLVSDHPELLRTAYVMGVTRQFLPEFDRMMETLQNNPHHCFTVGEHTIHAVQNTRPDLTLRLTMLLHDVGKPPCRWTDDNGIDHFWGHPETGAEMTEQILRRLKYDNVTVRNVTRLVLVHDNPLPETDAALRRNIAKVGEELFPLLLEVHEADVLAQGAFFLEDKLELIAACGRRFDAIMESRQALALKDLAVSGKDLILAGIKPGVAMGKLLETMLDDVLDHPEHNTREYLLDTYVTGRSS